MFDIGFWELLVIGIIALLVIGPERLPSFMRSTANTIKSIKSVANGFKEEVSQQLRTHELHENLKKAEKMGLDNIGGDIKKSVDELKAAAASVQHPYKKSSGSEPTSARVSKSEHSDESLPESSQQEIPVGSELPSKEPVSNDKASNNKAPDSSTAKDHASAKQGSVDTPLKEKATPVSKEK